MPRYAEQTDPTLRTDVDTLSIIRSKAERLSVLLPKSGILAVLRHVEMAERHFDAGRKGSDSDLFPDVIYRTNHAFEGILRESYTILAGQDPTKKSTYDIETYLAQNNVFHERVMELFANYRKKWRNPSTHDHVATFSESEAFLALLSVTSFVGILMDQMIERLAYEQEQARLAARSAELREDMAKHVDEPLVDRLSFLLSQFAAQAAVANVDSEIELAANLRAFLSTISPTITTQQEPLVHDRWGAIRPDFLLTEGDQRVVVELKRYRRWTADTERTALDQVRRYMDAADARGGILLVVPTPDAQAAGEKYNKTLAIPLDEERMMVVIRARSPKDVGNAETPA